MTLTKADIIQDIHEQCNIPKTQALQVTDTVLEIIKSTLESGEDVLISGFGKFSIRETKPRKGRNPATGNDILLDSRRVVIFNYSRVMKKRINS